MQLSTPLDTRRRRTSAILAGAAALQPVRRSIRQFQSSGSDWSSTSDGYLSDVVQRLRNLVSSDSSDGWTSDSTLAEGPVVGTYRWPLALYEDRLTTIPEDPLTDPPNDPLANWEERYPNAYREWQDVLRDEGGGGYFTFENAKKAAGYAKAAHGAYNYFTKEEKKDDTRDIYTGGGSSGGGGGGGGGRGGGVGVPRSNNSALLVLAVLLVAARRNF